MRHAAVLHPHLRRIFVEHVAYELRGQVVGDGVVFRACAKVLKESGMFDPPGAWTPAACRASASGSGEAKRSRSNTRHLAHVAPFGYLQPSIGALMKMPRASITPRSKGARVPLRARATLACERTIPEFCRYPAIVRLCGLCFIDAIKHQAQKAERDKKCPPPFACSHRDTFRFGTRWFSK